MADMSGIGAIAQVGSSIIASDAAARAARENAAAQAAENEKNRQLQRDMDRGWYGYAPSSAEKELKFYAPYKSVMAMGGFMPSKATRETYMNLPGQYLPQYQGNLNSIMSGRWGAEQVGALAPTAAARLNLASGVQEGAMSALNRATNSVVAAERMRSGSGGTPFMNRIAGMTIPIAQQGAMATSQAQLENAMQAEQVRAAAEQYRQGTFGSLPQAVGQIGTLTQLPWQLMAGDFNARSSMFGGLEKKFPLQYPPTQAPYMAATLPTGAAALGGIGSVLSGWSAQQRQDQQQKEMMDFWKQMYGRGGGGTGAFSGGSVGGGYPGWSGSSVGNYPGNFDEAASYGPMDTTGWNTTGGY